MEVWNVGIAGNRKHALGQGKATIDIDNIIRHCDGSQVLDIPLEYKTSSQGVVSLRLQISPIVETGKNQQDQHESVKAADGTSTRSNLLCQIDNLKASDLVNTGNSLDEQDPSLTITLGSRTFQTARFARYPSTVFVQYNYH